MKSTTARKKSGGLGEFVRTVVYAVLIALVVRTFAYEPFNIPSGSMLPTLLVGDFLFVSKFSYGYSRHSFPIEIPFDGRFMEGDGPERGDVVVFKKPTSPSEDFIKRVIGLPGERIQVIGGILHINGEQVARELVDGQVRIAGEPVPGINEYIETLPNGIRHRIWEQTDNGYSDDTRVFTVPEDHYFVMGDNRDNSQDSRSPEVGFVPAENLVGRAEFLFFSHDPTVPIWHIGDWLASIRVGRLFDGIN